MSVKVVLYCSGKRSEWTHVLLDAREAVEEDGAVTTGDCGGKARVSGAALE